ncbi:MAG: Hsp20/alpha crystallin family protein [Deltaproteobacteria bacterium]|nr:Hsp20/alpha crystallin family protein [Deltaproteobacteria bacterium]MBW1961370.1 Hsp20/alpha crystallin family protein [Deltaproteobacteria bacterium]MBW2152530.1 Hsp20/alpha crystallin family protein [Deltaproteobacteria bacterium]
MLVRRAFDFPTWDFRRAFEELERMRRDMDRLFESFGQRAFRPFGVGVFPLINLTEDRNNYYIRAELPGMRAEELNISVTGNGLSISGERKIPAEGDNVRYHRREREAGSFSRIIGLPGEVDPDKVEAKLKDGILTVIVPKAEKAKPKQIPIK